MNTPQLNRQIILDTETTGMNTSGGPIYMGHRIIEIGCVEVINRKLTGNHYHVYIKPDRLVDPEAIQVHGITDAYLADKPPFRQIADDFIEFIRGAELIAHNAPFDVSFMDYEFSKLGLDFKTADICSITDTLAMARDIFPGKRNNLDVLCDRYGIDNSHRTLHGALLDAEILADVYLLMTGGQTKLNLASENSENENNQDTSIRRLESNRPALNIVRATAEDLALHEARLDLVQKKGGSCLWRE
ncbi:MAG: DNA polymerase III subunit epsilon [Aeromonas sobria]|jgi:DNA polymerase-3 subunit epsilon|uniref:DNA polymerase III subunit epsilon n=1 Tax=Aeromonas sobria TaxID=646 RepID=A0A2N3IVN9_AERSO|nr:MULTISPECIES: DNA polymerase III subunit epsilon [Aeromonas]ATL91952.1 DNA polymerase III subunit epsilon [Aeromonas sp. CU5]EKP0258908.1 DNA polymerase III subunit epsilon [Aeromonas sobria]ELM3618421.1 DNA polymerase III subunit epsilon [Aeromonas sobria]MCX7128394.1 DNA polymerase III subunit epsilon [Aeromonas sp.]PKQ76403.1 DNA polymerase III subunit epsilon [Aeromonas sobria]